MKNFEIFENEPYQGSITVFFCSWQDTDEMFNLLLQDKELAKELQKHDATIEAKKFRLFSEGMENKVEYLIELENTPYSDEKVNIIAWRKITKVFREALDRNNSNPKF